VSTRWGIHTNLFCAGNDKTFRFLEEVLAEVAAMFPGKYIHIGGDECPPFKWQRCPRCQARIKEKGLKDEKGLHGWFMRRIASYLEGIGRKAIGWDEILEGGAPTGAAVQFWRGNEKAAEVMRKGHPAIISTTSYTYLDYGLAVTPLSKGLFLRAHASRSAEGTGEDVAGIGGQYVGRNTPRRKTPTESSFPNAGAERSAVDAEGRKGITMNSTGVSNPSTPCCRISG
jgi:hexosaminidase